MIIDKENMLLLIKTLTEIYDTKEQEAAKNKDYVTAIKNQGRVEGLNQMKLMILQKNK